MYYSTCTEYFQCQFMFINIPPCLLFLFYQGRTWSTHIHTADVHDSHDKQKTLWPSKLNSVTETQIINGSIHFWCLECQTGPSIWFVNPLKLLSFSSNTNIMTYFEENNRNINSMSRENVPIHLKIFHGHGGIGEFYIHRTYSALKLICDYKKEKNIVSSTYYNQNSTSQVFLHVHYQNTLLNWETPCAVYSI